MKRALVIAVAMAVACGEMHHPMPDAGPIVIENPPTCPPLPELEGFNFFGESCTAAQDPTVNTFCHGDNGWCVSGTCRPICAHRESPNCYACPRGTMQYSAGLACFCAPPGN